MAKYLMICAVLSSIACSSSQDETYEVPYVHTVVPWLPNENGEWFLIDTGAPRSLVRPSAVGQAPGTFQELSLDQWDVAGWEVAQLDLAITESLPASVLAAEARGELTGLSGILGGDFLKQHPFAIDIQNQRIIVGKDNAEYFPDTAMHVPIELLGGGSTCLSDGEQCIEFGRTRLVGEINLFETNTYAFIDTASTLTSVSRLTFDRWTAGAPPQELRIDFLDRPSMHLARAKTIVFGEAIRHNVPIWIRDDIDPALARLQIETNRSIDVILGQVFLGHFVTAFDYSIPSVTLFGYPTEHQMPWDEIRNRGFDARDSEDTAPISGLPCSVVFALYSPSPAQSAGLLLGDCVTSIDFDDETEITAISIERADGVIQLDIPTTDLLPEFPVE